MKSIHSFPLLFGFACTFTLNSIFSAPLEVIERGQNHQIVEVTQLTNNLSQVATVKTSRWTEIQAGLHYLNEKGQWSESQELIEVNAQGYAAASQGPYQVVFSPNLNTDGAVDILTPEKKRLRNHILGIYLTDRAKGQSILLASVRDSIGEVLPPNQIIYRSAFDGLDADVVYTYKKGAFEADVVLNESPIFPKGFAPASSRLELVTEFLSAPEPKTGRNSTAPADRAEIVDDAVIDFGEMQMLPGKAFSADGSTDQEDSGLHVEKQWRNMNGRQILIESISWEDAEIQMKSLPKVALNDTKATKGDVASLELPGGRSTFTGLESVHVASVPYKKTGFVIDYLIVVTIPNQTFLSGQTYLVPSSATISGSANFQAGAIIKFGRNGGLILTGSVTCPTSGTVFLTARDDDSIGESTSTGPLIGYYGNPHYLDLYNYSFSITLRQMYMRYAKEGVAAYAPYYQQAVVDSRFENCQRGVTAYATIMTLKNLIMCNTPTQYYNYGGSTFSVSGITANCSGSVGFTTLNNGTTLQGSNNIPVEVVSGDHSVWGVNLYANGEGADGVEVVRNANGTWTAKWETGFMANGAYSVDLRADLDPTAQSLISATRTVTLDNPVLSDEFYSTFGSQIWIFAQFKQGPAHVRINLFDQNNSYILTFDGEAPAGYVSFAWNVTDFNGNPVPGDTFHGDVYVSAAGSPMPPNTVRSGILWWRKEEEANWSQDGFAVAWGWANYRPGIRAAIDQMIRLSANDTLTFPAADAPYSLNPPNGWNTGFSFFLESGTKSALLANLGDVSYRNFFWYGHGNPSGIGYDNEDSNGVKIPGDRVGLYASEIANATGNTGRRIRHGYRLVFLHSCSGSAGALPKAFGIDRKQRLVAYYQRKGVKSRAFIGSPIDSSTAEFPNEMPGLGESFAQFFSQWMQNVPVSTCLSSAQNFPPPGGTRIPLAPDFVVRGAVDLQRNSP